jgi:hypothetical protein
MAEEPTGFAGFESQVTDLSDLPAPAAPRTARPAASGRSFPVWIFILIGVSVFGRLLAAIPNNGQPSVTNHYLVAPASQSPVLIPPSPSYRPAPAATEEKPPVGQGALESEPQIRYCLSQGIRVQGADKAVNADSKAEVTRFLPLVDDYKSRCGSDRFGLGVQAVKGGVEARQGNRVKEFVTNG